MTTTESQPTPVDSATRPCCKGIGRHTHDCQYRPADPATAACPYAWCKNPPGPNHIEHQWNDAAPAKVSGQPGLVYVYAVAFDGDQFDDEVLVGVQQNDDAHGEDAAEAWMTIENAEYLRDTLTKAIAYARREKVVER